jgi:hypothetical protein
MITLYVNGDSHSSRVYGTPGTSFAEQLVNRLPAKLINRAMPGSSNRRIIRTSFEDLAKLDPHNTVVLIGWSSFERTEWYFDQHWHNVAGSVAYNLHHGLLDAGNRHLEQFQNNSTYCLNCHLEQHQNIWNFYSAVSHRGFRCLFFQGCKTFFFDSLPEQDQAFKFNWPTNTWAHNPYVSVSVDGTRHIESFSHLCEQQGFQHADAYAHYGQDAHDYWTEFLIPKIQNLIN